MKELSIEEKAKRYDEAIKKAGERYNEEYTSTLERSTLAYVFPELKESEDERIRKELLAWLKSRDGQTLPIDRYNAAVAWLEKQGKNNMGISEATKQELEDNLNKALETETPESCYEFLDEQGEQKLPIEKLSSEMKTVGESLGFTNQEECNRYNQMVTDLIMSDDDKGEQKPYGQRQECVDCQFNYAGECKGSCTMKRGEQKFTDKVEPKSVEWSEEDEKIYNLLYEEYENIAYYSHSREKAEDIPGEVLGWLKSIKERYTWKPSDEQMAALSAINVAGCISYAGQGQELINLYNDLKKL